MRFVMIDGRKVTFNNRLCCPWCRIPRDIFGNETCICTHPKDPDDIGCRWEICPAKKVEE